MKLQIASSSVENKNNNVASCMLKLPALILAENVHHSFVTLCICILMKLKKAHKWRSGVKRNSCLDSSLAVHYHSY
jgi:hypothetical protein